MSEPIRGWTFKPMRSLPRPKGETIETSFRVGRFRCEISLRLDAADNPQFSSMKTEWTPHLPRRGDLQKQHLEIYRLGRNALCQRWADITGLTFMVVD